MTAPVTILVTAGSDGWGTATATVAGQNFDARSRNGAIFALCRVLVAAGIPDAPWQAINTARPDTVSLRGASIHESAKLTVREGDRGGPRFVRWTPGPQKAR